MPRPGIPPSLDRRDFAWRVGAMGAIVALAGGGLIFWFSRATYDTAAYHRELGVRDAARIDPAAEETERASAYKEIRDHMDQRNWGSDIRAVYCRDSSHQIVDDAFVFRGDVDLEQADGEMIRMTYRVRIRGSSFEGWTIESADISGDSGYSSSEGEAGGGASD